MPVDVSNFPIIVLSSQVQAKLIEVDRLFLHNNAVLTGGVSGRAFLPIFAKTATVYGVRVPSAAPYSASSAAI
jgi:hypothetical protein